MKTQTAAFCLFALIALSCVADSKAAVFCRYSSYQINPVVVLNLKKVFFKACGYKVKTSGLPKKHNEIVISKVYTENPRASKAKQCNSIKQTTLTEDDWNKFKACQDAHPKWPILFAKRSQCSKYQKSVGC